MTGSCTPTPALTPARTRPYLDVWAHGVNATSFTVPADAQPGDVFNIVFEATDNGAPALTRYAQAIVTVIEAACGGSCGITSANLQRKGPHASACGLLACAGKPQQPCKALRATKPCPCAFSARAGLASAAGKLRGSSRHMDGLYAEWPYQRDAAPAMRPQTCRGEAAWGKQARSWFAPPRPPAMQAASVQGIALPRTSVRRRASSRHTKTGSSPRMPPVGRFGLWQPQACGSV